MQRLSKRTDGKHPSSICDYDIFTATGAGMKNHTAHHTFQTTNRIAFLISLRIPAGNDNHRRAETFIKSKGYFSQTSRCRCHQQVDKIGFQTGKHHFCFRITHAHIIFDDKRFSPFVHQSKKKETAVVYPIGTKPLYRRTDNTFLHLAVKRLVSKWNRGYRPHTAGIKTTVTLPDTLIIFGRAEYFVILAIGNCKNGNLYACKVFFNHDPGTGRAEFPGKHESQLLLRFPEIIQNKNPFPRCQTIRLQHIRRLQSRKIFLSRRKRLGSNGHIACGRNPVAHHELFGKIFAAFQNSTGLSGTYNQQVGKTHILLQEITNTGNERIFRTYHKQVDSFLGNKIGYRREIMERQSNIDSNRISTRITRSNIQCR